MEETMMQYKYASAAIKLAGRRTMLYSSRVKGEDAAEVVE